MGNYGTYQVNQDNIVLDGETESARYRARVQELTIPYMTPSMLYKIGQPIKELSMPYLILFLHLL